MEKFYIEKNEEGIDLLYMRDGDIVWSVPMDTSNSDYQRYLRWLDGEDEDGTLS